MAKKKTGLRLTMRQRRAITGYVFLLPFIIGFVFFILTPLISSVRMSLSEVKLNPTGGGFTMKFIGLENYIRAVAVDKDFNRLLTESLLALLVDVPSIIITSLVLAVLLKRKFPGRGAVRAIFFMPVILASGVVLGMEKANALLAGIQDMQAASTNTSITGVVSDLLLGGVSGAATGIVNTIMDIINHFYDIVISSSIQTVIFLSALQTINPSIYEAAETEGCSAWECFWKITFPMISPMILVNWIYTIIDRFTRADNQIMEKILKAIGVTMEFGFSSAMAWIYCLSMLALIGISSLIISKWVYYYD